MNIISCVFMAFTLILSLQNIIHAVRAFVIGRKANILKVWVTPAVIIQAVLCAFWIVIAVNRFSVAADYRSKAAMYEQIASIDGSDRYQNVAVYSDVQNRLLEQVGKLRESADIMTTAAWYMLMLGIFEFTLIFNMIWYFTEDGVVLGKLKFPEPITAEYRNGKIDVYYKAQLANNKKIKSFKATPKNIAVFGRFIEWENTQPPASPTPPAPPAMPRA